MNKNIPIFFSIDDNYLNFFLVTIESLKENRNKSYNYTLYVLHTNLTSKTQEIIRTYEEENFTFEFVDMSKTIEEIGDKLCTRDYYTKTTYYRLFVPDMFPDMDKALYLDSDICVTGDVSNLYNIDIETNLIGAVPEQSTQLIKEFQVYANNCLGLDYNHYFNAGIIIMNFKKMREIDFSTKVLDLISTYEFRLAQDQDILNVICRDKVVYIDNSWNRVPLGEKCETPNIIHYLLVYKPWKMENVMYEEYFWEYAKKAGVEESIRKNSTMVDREVLEKEMDRVKKLAIEEAFKEDNYYNMFKTMDSYKGAYERSKILKEIEVLEANGVFNTDLENDPPTIPLKEGEVDYTKKKLTSKLKAKLADFVSFRFFKRKIRKGEIVIDGYEGIENLKSIKSGAVITSNHFNPFDCVPIHIICKKYQRKRQLFKVIREGNYHFPGIYGYFMKNCYTMPLSHNHRVQKEMIDGTEEILKRGKFLLVYAEQYMWWNYRKPKPLKSGAFTFACKANVPILPTFITMRDTNKFDSEGYPIQAYTLHIGKPIYPKEELSYRENVEYLRTQNERVWKNIYESAYKMPLSYTYLK